MVKLRSTLIIFIKSFTINYYIFVLKQTWSKQNYEETKYNYIFIIV